MLRIFNTFFHLPLVKWSTDLVPKNLKKILDDSNTSLLIIDIRSNEEFHRSHINFRNIINIPAENLPPG